MGSIFIYLFVLIVRFVLAYSVYTITNDKGYSKGMAALLAFIAIFVGGILMLVIVLCIPETVSTEHASYKYVGGCDWKCSRCGNVNNSMYNCCSNCGSSKSSSQVKMENWTCRVCQKNNSYVYSVCDCGAKRF